MTCPVCDETLREVTKHGVNVDICPGCKGVWLDRGELEKIVELVSTDGPVSGLRNDQPRSQYVPEEPRRPSRDHDERGEQGSGQRKKKGSWLGDILGGLGGD